MVPFPQTRAGRRSSVVPPRGRLSRETVQPSEGVHQRLCLRVAGCPKISETKCKSMMISISGGLLLCPYARDVASEVRYGFLESSLLVLVYIYSLSFGYKLQYECKN